MSIIATDFLSLNGENSGLHREALISPCFSATHYNKTRYEKESRVKLKDGSELRIVFKAQETLSVREMKNTYTLIKFCYDNRHKIFPNGIENYDQEGVTIKVKSRDILKFINERTTLERRRNLFESISRVADMSYRVTTIPCPNNPDQRTKVDARKQWIYEVTALNDYEDLEVRMSVALIKQVTSRGLTFNLKKMMEFTGRSTFLYTFMQSQRHKIEKQGKTKYIYNDYIDHFDLLEALDLIKQTNKRRAISYIKKAFADFEEKTSIKYEFQSANKRWKKVSK